MKIGNIDLGDKPLFLAPMEDVTDASFRFICKEFGADMMYTEFISSDGLIRDARKSLEKLVTYDYEAPIGIQIYGNIPEAMVDAAKMAEQAAEIAGGHGADLVDINFGCPVKKVARKGCGAGMLQNIPKLLEITKAVVDAVKVPVTVKTRLGWDENSKCIVDLAERLQDCGIAALTVHGRTRAQMYTGDADWTLIGEIKKNPRMHIPIIGNGDVKTPERAKECFDKYGVDAVMIGRASFGQPWIFRDVKHYLEHGEAVEPFTFVECMDILRQQVRDSVEWLGERPGILHVRRHLAATPLLKGLTDFRPLRIAMLRAEKVDELMAILDEIVDKYGK